MSGTQDFSDRVVLVTGAAGDIGAAAAREFASRGADVILVDRRVDALNVVANSIAGKGKVRVFLCDQTDPVATQRLFAQIEQDCGRLDAAFVNAGFGRYGPLLDLSFEQWKRHVDVNLNGGFLIGQGAARLMAKSGDGGAIVFNASTAAAYVCDLLGAYAASKAGLRMLARSFASELGPHRIRVNLVMPGVIETAMTESLIADPAVRQDVLSETPLGRIGKPDDIARAAAFLCSREAGYITGAEILVDGGQTIHGYPRWFSTDYSTPGGAWTPHSSGTRSAKP